MSDPMDLYFFYNFRSPYCYLVSKTVWSIFDDFHVTLKWRPLGGWTGRSDPDRAKVKIPLVRQDVGRWAKRLGVPYTPPPITTDPTRAGAASLYAESQGKVREFTVETMRAEWGEGRDIGDLDVLRDVSGRIGLDPEAVVSAADSQENLAVLEEHAAEAAEKGVFGVPTFLVGDAIFWGNDRLDFLREHLMELRLKRL
ncbi:MAG: 2-hydroxychromene-2-carboxylate isomerase [Magnetospiraceae bacterium]